jgi:hypothetical protein
MDGHRVRNNSSVLRTKIFIDEITGKPVKEMETLEHLFTKGTKRKNIIEFFKEKAKIINDMDD